MLTLTVREGQAVQIGELGAIKLNKKYGRAANMTFFFDVSPIRILADGLVPARFTTGITGEPRRVPRQVAAAIDY